MLNWSLWPKENVRCKFWESPLPGVMQWLVHVFTATFDCTNCALLHSRDSHPTVVYANDTPPPPCIWAIHNLCNHRKWPHKIFEQSLLWQRAHNIFRGVVGSEGMSNSKVSTRKLSVWSSFSDTMYQPIALTQGLKNRNKGSRESV